MGGNSGYSEIDTIEMMVADKRKGERGRKIKNTPDTQNFKKVTKSKLSKKKKGTKSVFHPFPIFVFFFFAQKCLSNFFFFFFLCVCVKVSD